MKLLMSLITSAGLISCSVFSPVNTPSNHQYVIQYSTPTFKCATKQQNISIQVLMTDAESPYNSYNMYYTNSPYELKKYSYSTWAILPQQTINQAIEKSLMNSCTFSNVIGSDVLIPTQYKIKTRLLELKQNITKEQTNVTISILIQLINSPKNSIKNSKIFIESANIQPSPQNMAYGTSQNLQLFLTELNNWLSSQFNQ